MTELYIFSQDDKLLTILSESTGLIEALFREELNSGSSFSFTVKSDADRAKHVIEENQVVFRDHEGDLRLYVIKEIDDMNNDDGPETTATCEPAFMELKENIIDDRRFDDQLQDKALDAALQGTRWVGKVEVELFKGTTNFYHIDSVEAIWKILDVWGGDFKDVVTFDEKNNIKSREIIIKQRLGADGGLRFDIDHNTEEIQRTVLSYPLTAMWGWGASLELEDEEGEATGGHSRYIDFSDVEWKKSKGDPVDKPLGQKWVGDLKALEKYGRLHNGSLLHRYGKFSNQDYETPEELLQATWEALQEAQQVEVNYQLKVYLMDKSITLGDTAQAIDRQFARPIEIQTRIISLSYDLMDIEGTMEAEMGQFLSAHTDDPIRDLEGKIDDARDRADQANRPIDKNKYPDKKPKRPINVVAEGGFKVIQLYWDYTDEIFVRYYEVYGSQVKDFVPDSQHLLWKGDVSAFAHEVDTDQTWYYYVRSVNYHDRPSDYSGMVQASTVRVISDDILFGEDLAEKLRELSKIADLLADGSVSWDQISNEAKDLIEVEYKQYTDEEIEETKTDLLKDIADKAGFEYVDGKLKNKVDLSEYNLFKGDYEETIVNIDQRADGLAQSVSETNVRIDNLDIRGTNFITHLPENWESGTRYHATGNKGSNSQRIRLKKLYALEPEENYVLACYREASYVAVHLFDKNDNFIRAVYAGYNDDDTWVTFQTAENETKYTVVTGANHDVIPDDIGDKLRVKLGLGIEYSGWTPNLDDTGQLVANVQEYVSEWEQTSKQIKADVSALEVAVKGHDKEIDEVNSTLLQQADLIESKIDSKKYNTDMNDVIGQLDQQSTLIQQNISDIKIKADKTYVDNTTDSISKSVSELNVKYNEISSTVRDIRIGSRNIIINSDLTKKENIDKWTAIGDVSFTNSSPVKYEGFNKSFARVSIPVSEIGYNARIRTAYNVSLVQGQTNTLSWIAASSDWVSSEFNYTAILGSDGYFVGGNLADRISKEKIGEALIGGYTKPIYKYRVTFKHAGETADNFAVMFGTKTTRESSAYFIITEPMLENGTMASDWQPAIEDMDQRMSIAESDITQLADDITLKVDRDNVVSQININPEGIRLDGALIELNGLTLIRDGVIGNAAIANGSINKAKMGTAVVGTAQIENGAITNAKVASLNADKINATNLASISANLGTVTAGIMRSSNNNFDLNLNTGKLVLKNTKFDLGGNAKIHFTSRSNDLYYDNLGVYGGLKFDHSLNGGGRPLVALGVSDLSLDVNDSSWKGIRIHSSWVEGNVSGVMTNIISNELWLNSDPQYDNGGWVFQNAWDGKKFRTLHGMNADKFSYNLGYSGYGAFSNVYANNLRYVERIEGGDDILFRNRYDNSNAGWTMKLAYAGESTVDFYPVNTGSNYYNFGRPNNRINRGYINNVHAKRVIQQSTADDKQLIDFIDLNMAYDLIKKLEPKSYFYNDDEILSTNPSDPEYYKGRKVGFMLEDVQDLTTDYKYYLMDAEETGLDNQNFITLLWQANRQMINTLGLSPDSLTFGGNATFEGDIKAAKITGSSFRTESSNSHLDIDAASIKANTVLDAGSGSGSGTDSLLTIHGQIIQLHERKSGEIISISPGNIFMRDSGGDMTTISGSTIDTHTVKVGNIYQNNGNYLYLGANNEVRATDTNTYTSPITYVPMRAKSFPTGTSLRENKTGIEVFEDDVLSEIKVNKAYLYRLKGDEGNPQKQLGLMVDETPRLLHGEAGDSMEMYALGTYVYRGVQQLAINDELQDRRITNLEHENKMLKERVRQLEKAG
ncbi:tail protein [Virgibacillus phage Mimir87]|nr:tail protein [Virgibacillus phage Mimir87]